MTRLSRLTRLAVATALGGSLIVPPALAQDAPPPPSAEDAAPAAPAQAAPESAPGPAPAAPGPAPAASATPAADPPARAGRIARLSGTVSFHGPGADHWEAATLNFPVSDGDSLWTEPQAGAAMDVSGSRITLAGGTELDVTKLDAETMAATAPQGELYLKLAYLAPGETYSIATPRGTVTINTAGRYEIAAGDQASPTLVTVLAGRAMVSGDNLDLAVGPAQTASITGDQTFQGSVGPEHADAFIGSMEQQAPPPVVPVAQAAPPPAAVQAMPGAADLNQYGAWQPSPEYGTVWYPQVDQGWVPYRNGRWAFVAPWGWTWVDDAPWGFAPFHYGRWVQYGGRWGWAPVYHEAGWVAPAAYIDAPVYAPALVSFVGIGIGVGVGIGVGIGLGASVGWCPLGWGEPYHPWYGGSRGYVQNINRSYVRNVTNITNVTNNTTTINNFANRGAATVVPAGTLTGSRPVAPAAQRLTPQQVGNLRPTQNVAVQPTAATAGVTPTVARQLRLPASPAGAPARPTTPGPTITPATAGAHPATPGLPTAVRTNSAAPAAAGLRPAAPGTPATPNAAPAHLGAPGPAIAPHTAGTAGPAIVPHNAGTAGTAPVTSLRPATTPATTPGAPNAPANTQAAHPVAPGPAITPHTAGTPALRPTTPTLPAPGSVPAHINGVAGTPNAVHTNGIPAAPNAVHTNGVANAPTAVHTPATHTPATLATVPHAAPTVPTTPHAAPVHVNVPQQQHPLPQVIHPTPAAPAAVTHAAPPPQPHVAAPPPQQHFSAPAPQHQAPPPQHRSCAPGQKNC